MVNLAAGWAEDDFMIFQILDTIDQDLSCCLPADAHYVVVRSADGIFFSLPVELETLH